MKGKLWRWSFIILVLVSCEELGREYYSFSDKAWNSEEEVQFDIEVNDSTPQYFTNVSLRHTTSYKYQNIIMFIHHYFDNKKVKTDTVDIYLAEDNGKWIGKGKNDIKEITYKLEKKSTYQKGIHSFKLELAMRKNELLKIDELKNISDIVIYLTKEDD